MLLHAVPADSENVTVDYQVVRKELEKYNPELLDKEEIIVLTKTDLVDKKQIKEKITQLKKFKKKVIPVSIHDWDSLKELEQSL